MTFDIKSPSPLILRHGEDADPASEELYGALKGLAARQEWSLAETLRRGAEQILQQYPPSGGPAASAAVWQPPVSSKCGWNGLSATELKAALAADTEPRLSAG